MPTTNQIRKNEQTHFIIVKCWAKFYSSINFMDITWFTYFVYSLYEHVEQELHQTRNQKSSLIVGYHLYPEMRSLKSCTVCEYSIIVFHVYLSDIGDHIHCIYRTYQRILIAVDGHSSPMFETVQNSIMHSGKDTPFSDDIREEAATLKLFHHQCLSENNAQATYFISLTE